MLRRIVLDNFMSHAHTVIEPADGLTVLVGPNNCGKSAVVSALQTLVANLSGDYMVRHGERETSVTVETDDGHAITWRRRGSTVSYTIDGEEVHRLRGGVPERLHELLRLPKVRSQENGEDEFDIHFGTQKAPIFLLNESERRAAVFFAASSDAALLLEMQKRHAERVKDNKRERGKLSDQLTRLDAELAALAPLGDVASRLQLIEQEHEALEQRGAQLLRLTTELGELVKLRADLMRRHTEHDVLTPLQLPPELADVRPLDSLAHSIDAANSRRVAESQLLRAMAALHEPPPIADVDVIDKLCGDLSDAANDCNGATRTAICLQRLRDVPDFRDTTGLTLLTHSLETECGGLDRETARLVALDPLQLPPMLRDFVPLESLVRELQRSTDVCLQSVESNVLLAELSPPPTLADPTPLTLAIDQIQGKRDELAELARTLEQIDRQRADAATQIREWASANPICQTCGAAIDPERLMAGGHEHA